MQRPLCKYHKTPLDELWPGELLCEQCLEDQLMSAEETEVFEEDVYENLMKDSN